MRKPALITSDGFLDPETLGGIGMHEGYGAPTVAGHMVVRLRSDLEQAMVHDLEAQGAVDMIGKSGHSRVHLAVDRRENEKLIFDGNHRVIVPVDISSLRGVEIRRNGVQDELLSVLSDVVRERRREVYVGRLALVSRDDALDRGELMDAISHHRLLLPAHVLPERDIADDGLISLPLEPVEYRFCEANFDEDAMRRVIRYGKHGMEGIQQRVAGLPPELRGRQGFVGAMHLSIGPYTAILERATSSEHVMHLPARVLDGLRTTGIDYDRQVELFNLSRTAVPTDQLTVRARVYHATKEVQQFSKEVINRRTIKEGVSFADVLKLHERPEALVRLMKHVSPHRDYGGPHGFLIGAQKFREVPWLDLPEFQHAHLTKVNAKFAASDPKYAIFGKDVPYFARDISSILRYVGLDQSKGRMCVTWGFPPSEVIGRMRDEGTGVFVAHDLRVRKKAYDLSEEVDKQLEEGPPPANDVYFDEELYNDFRHMGREGLSFYLVRHKCRDAACAGGELPAEVMEWNRRGFWVRPDQRERLEKVDTVIAMYGSHVKGMERLLHEQILRFSLRMKRRFGNALAYIHGKGPGVMQIADEIAERLPELARAYPEFGDDIHEDIFRIGVGIDAERFGQSPNFHPPAQADFRAKDRLTRQKLMNDIATINIFNVGGAGTLEEIAISLCSQKLCKNIPAPMIFVDPQGAGEEGRHLWALLIRQIEVLAEQKVIGGAEVENGYAQIQLLQQYVPKFLHICTSYDEAADVIERFANDPAEYLIETGISKDRVFAAYSESVETFRETGFTRPSWLSLDQVLEDERWSLDAPK